MTGHPLLSETSELDFATRTFRTGFVAWLLDCDQSNPAPVSSNRDFTSTNRLMLPCDIPLVPSDDGTLADDSITNQSLGAVPVDEAPSLESTVSCTSPPHEGRRVGSTGITIFWPSTIMFIGGVMTNCGEDPEGAVTIVGITAVRFADVGIV